MLAAFQYQELIEQALQEDLGTGDLSAAIFPKTAWTRAKIYAKQKGVLCGLEVTKQIFKTVDAQLDVKILAKDGEKIERGTVVIEITGPVRSILSAERTALNFLQHLSGVASATYQAVKECEGLPTRITDTRKTLPGLRMLQKYAVRMGGGQNHRFGLYDAVMLKDNHIAAAGGIRPAVEAARHQIGHMVKIEVECETLQQVEEAVASGAEVIMLDNMNLEEMHKAVNIVNGRAILEASGGIKKGSVRAVAETGVDVISIGAITHSVKALDFSLDIGDIKAQTKERWENGENCAK
ncbi:nicotinate-nucleotide pyrophosphorylase (carboxylating) [Desulfitobacterium dichloroeliminans LMG P-21439]|uniref:Probable nicotinate-nucleotide pyrophosphorylase [carboxylating] n=1 Tax=Desulfitobacterium dichloroeliminans (strain LMG P-21439 / DCA1) TaxID=871963 RepID=L0F406_DESDL|nr:carboxylating nicotinate-nucleotide diphosphorylase [Desulfitobacterium dichloroeliminans]AGA67663.1 nicotinate-nucleotide pyrophosphorylase (carboxylating) [Desulfitobacterium dichloroeliminans LMG P-21439]